MSTIDELIESLEGEAQGLLAAELNHTSTPAGPAANVMIEAAAALSTLQEQKMKLEEALRALVSTPAVKQVLGTKHTPDCRCPMCRARALLSGGGE